MDSSKFWIKWYDLCRRDTTFWLVSRINFYLLVLDDHPLIKTPFVDKETKIEDIEYKKMFRKYKQVIINYTDYKKTYYAKPKCKE